MLPDQKYKKLVEFIRGLERAAVAFSGGVDSALLTFASKEALDDRAAAFTVWSPLLSAKDKDEVLSFAEMYSVKLFKIEHNDLESTEFCKNGPERCYICKSRRLAAMASVGEKLGIPWILDGSNIDDLNDSRPGMKSLSESSVTLCPLLECSLSKRDIREISSGLEIPTADKPSAACLASRIPTGIYITEKMISAVDKGENIIRKYLPVNAQLRMRYDGQTAKIETDRANIPGLINSLGIIAGQLECIGITDVFVDKNGYSTGGTTFQQK